MTGVNTLFALRRLPHIGNALRGLPRDSEPRLYLEEQLEVCNETRPCNVNHYSRPGAPRLHEPCEKLHKNASKPFASWRQCCRWGNFRVRCGPPAAARHGEHEMHVRRPFPYAESTAFRREDTAGASKNLSTDVNFLAPAIL
jgi:hypothetical protein